MDSVFFDTYIWPALIVTAHSLAIILALLVSLAFFMLADRKIGRRRNYAKARPWSARLACCKVLPIF